MATSAKLSAFALLVILFADSLALGSTIESSISASPVVLLYAAAPEVSSFYPTTTADKPMSSLASPEVDSSATMAPSSGEFVGKKASSTTRLDCEAVIVGILLCSLMVTSILAV